MPGRDGTGPFGTCFGGRGLGICLRNRRTQGYGQRCLNGFGFRGAGTITNNNSQSSYDSLETRKESLKMELDAIERQLGNK